MEPITTFMAKMVALPIDNIDTDQIIPARFLKATDKEGMADALFADWRFHSDGTPIESFVLNRADVNGAEVLIAGNNFGCGSSREHAPWALKSYGFKAIVSTYFADIFRNNALKNGVLPIAVDTDTYQQLLALWEHEPSSIVTVDLAKQTLTFGIEEQQVLFPVESFAKYCLLNGLDQLGFLLQQEDKIAAYEEVYPSVVETIKV